MKPQKKFLCLILLSLVTPFLWAAKSAGIIRTWSQPDGTTVKVQLLGDEHVSWYQTPDGILLVRNENGAFYVAEVDADGMLKATNVLAHDQNKRTAAETALAKAQRREAFFDAADKKLQATRAGIIEGYPSKKHCPHIGNIRVPIILIEYADMKLSFDREVYEEYFNGTTRTEYSKETRFDGFSSIREYFLDASHGLFYPTFELYGPYTTERNHDYYGKKSGKAIATLVSEAVKKADPDIDFSQYDSNNDGVVDMVYVFYAGTGANLSGDDYDVWPACYPGNQSYSTSDNVKITTIGAANELAIYADGSPTGKNLRAGIGVTIHEMSHGLGLPDLYNTGTPKNPATGLPDYSNGGPEDWDIMDGGENLFNAMWPCQYSAWERNILGWLDIEELTEPADITIYPLNDVRGKAYRVTNPANPNEFYIIENNNTSPWNYYQRTKYGTGLMIYHLNASPDGFSMTPNNSYGKPNITILPADGYIMGLYNKGETIMYKGKRTKMPDDDSEFRSSYFNPEMKGDPYPGSKNITSLAAYHNYTKVDGDMDMVELYPITNIIANENGSISFRFMNNYTSIHAVTDIKELKDGKIYSLDGVFLGTNPSLLPSGMYIQNGHKVLKR